jgi:hypothetical protein
MAHEWPDLGNSTLIFDITSEDLSLCIDGADRAINLTRDKLEVEDEYSATDFARCGTRHSCTHTRPEIFSHTTTHVHRLKEALLRLQTEIKHLPDFETWPGDLIFALLNRLGLTSATHEAFVQLLGAAVSWLEENEDSKSIEVIALEKLVWVIRTVFRRTPQQARKHAQYYRVRMQCHVSSGSRVISTLSYWSDTPALRMRIVTDSTERTAQVLRP